MAQVSFLGASQAALDALAAPLAAMTPLGPYTLATLPAASAANLYRLATVTDLFGSRATRVRCEKVTIAGADYHYWQPSSSDSFGPLDVSGTNTVIAALSMPTTLALTGDIAPGVIRNVTMLDGAFPGQVKEVRMTGLLGASASLLMRGTNLGAGAALVSGGYARFVSDWYSAPPQRLWVRLV